jgi:histidine triad (HIT) family protein
MKTVDECLFCKIISGEIPSYKVYEDDFAYAFLDINPIAAGHTLVLPKVHVTKLAELGGNALSGWSAALQRVVAGVEKALEPEGLNIFINQGDVAGQVIPHLHAHLVPRSQGDEICFDVPGIETTEKEFKEISEKITSSI